MGAVWLPRPAAALIVLCALASAADNITTTSERPSHRSRRHDSEANLSPRLVPGPPGKLNVPIPTNIAVFGGTSTTEDSVCDRDEVVMETDGTCQQLLTDGNCLDDEEVLLNPETNKGYCAPRLCSPDRIFIFSTQLCHDPQEKHICPPGRELYVSGYGTPVCQCPDGTYEGDEDLDDDVCEPLLGQIPNCPHGQVFWFRKLDLGPECTPDPCGGLNLNRGPNDLPFLPSLINDRCFQMGSSDGICPTNMWYGLDLESLKGVCDTIEEFGYNVFDADTLKDLLSDSSIIDNTASPLPTNHSTNGFISQPSKTVISNHVASTQPNPTAQILSPQPSQQINQIQQQIGILQQQLNQLQQSLGNTTVTSSPQRTESRAQNQGHFVSQAGHTFPNSGKFHQSTSSSPSTSPIIIKATLESHFSETTLPALNQRSSPSPMRNQQIFTTFYPTPNQVTPQNVHTTPQQIVENVNFRRQEHQSSTRSNPFHSHQTSHTQSESNPTFNQVVDHARFGQSHNRQPTTQHQSQSQTHDQHSAFSPSGNHVHNGQDRRFNQHPTEIIHSQPNLVQVQPIEFVHINHHQPNSIEHFTAFGQQFPPVTAQPPWNSGQSFHSGNRHHHRHGGSQIFIRSDSLESLNGDFVFSARSMRGKRSTAVESSRGSRRRRSPLPHASPSNVFESRLLSCRGGARRDINRKCRNVILPSRLPKRAVRSPKRPVPPRRPCSGLFNIFRRCVSSAASAASSVNAFALG